MKQINKTESPTYPGMFSFYGLVTHILVTPHFFPSMFFDVKCLKMCFSKNELIYVFFQKKVSKFDDFEKKLKIDFLRKFCKNRVNCEFVF